MGRLISIDFKAVTPETATISVMDRSFLYGDSVYEVVRTYRGTVPFLLDQHYQRLLRSAERIRLKIPFSLEKLEKHIVESLKQVKNDDSYVRIVVSRGADNRFDLAPGPHLQPTTVILIDRIHQIPKSYFEEGVAVALVSVRRNLRTALDPNIKSGNYMNNVLALMEAREQNALDAVMLNAQGFVTEATTSNVFAVWGGKVRTPRAEAGILEGISRALLKEVMTKNRIPFEEIDISQDQFCSAEEIFLTGTVKELMPVAQVDREKVGKECPGPITRKLMQLYRDEINRRIEAASR